MTLPERTYIASIVSPSIATFIKEAAQNIATTNECFVDYTIDSFTATTASVLFSVYTFNGGAHGNTQLIPCNYDRRTLHPFTLTDIAPSWSIQSLSAEAVRQLAPALTICTDKTMSTQDSKEWQHSSMRWLQEGAAPVTRNFEVFTFNQRRLRIYFEQYQVACYAAGIRTIDIPGAPEGSRQK